MNGFFQLLMILCFLSIVVSFIGIPYAFKKKKRKKPFVTALAVSILLLFASGFAYHQTESPDQLATDQKRHEERLAAKAQEKAAKEQAAADAELQKKYDDQAEYEAWIAQKNQQEQDAADAELQKKYDDQAEYEAWIAKKEQQKYDDQAAYEAWVPAEIERICRNSLGSSFISVDVNDDYGHYGSGNKIVLPHFVASSQNRNSILKQSGELLRALYAEDLPISEVTTFTAKSEGGMNIAKCTLTSNRANSIAWDSINYKKLPSYIDEFWCIPALR